LCKQLTGETPRTLRRGQEEAGSLWGPKHGWQKPRTPAQFLEGNSLSWSPAAGTACRNRPQSGPHALSHCLDTVLAMHPKGRQQQKQPTHLPPSLPHPLPHPPPHPTPSPGRQCMQGSPGLCFCPCCCSLSLSSCPGPAGCCSVPLLRTPAGGSPHPNWLHPLGALLTTRNRPLDAVCVLYENTSTPRARISQKHQSPACHLWPDTQYGLKYLWNGRMNGAGGVAQWWSA
jgi:hypothetical protein